MVHVIVTSKSYNKLSDVENITLNSTSKKALILTA